MHQRHSVTHLAVLDIQETLWANRHVEMLSLRLLCSKETVAIIDVRQLPPANVEDKIIENMKKSLSKVLLPHFLRFLF